MRRNTAAAMGVRVQRQSLVDRHNDMRSYLQHRQRVLEVKPKVPTARSRANSLPSRAPNRRRTGYHEQEEQRRIQKENERLLKKLVIISNRKSEYALPTKRPSSISRMRSVSINSLRLPS